MMRDLLNAQKAAAQQATQGRAATRHGTVTSYDPNAYAVKVTLQPDNVVTGWIPLKSAWVGAGWGLFYPPTIGDAVEVDFQEDDGGVGSVGLRFFNDTDRPLPCPSGEFWLVHKTGSLLKFHNDGSVELVTNQDLNATVGRHANLTVAQTVVANVSGNVTATVTGSTKITSNGGVTIDGAGGGATKGIVQGDCVCAFTGMPHAMISGNVKGSV
jgi:hypothetical protein